MNSEQISTFYSRNGVEVKDIYIEPLACESLGIRSMATYVETPDVRATLDPGISHGIRDKLPHPREEEILQRYGDKILYRASGAEVLAVSHYHFDHYMPSFFHWANYGDEQTTKQLYRGKELLLKAANNSVSTDHKKRAKYLFNRKDCQTKPADDRTFRYGSTKFIFSPPVSHGPPNTKLGKVLIMTIRTKQATFVFAPDVQGPMVKETYDYIVRQQPDLLLVGGPPTHLRGKVSPQFLEQGIEYLALLTQKIQTVVVDHHVMRDRKWKDMLHKPYETARDHEHWFGCCAQLLGRPVTPLEANREDLWKNNPPPVTWKYELQTR